MVLGCGGCGLSLLNKICIGTKWLRSWFLWSFNVIWKLRSMWFEINVRNNSYVFFYDSKNYLMLWQAVISWSFYCDETWFTEVYCNSPSLSNILRQLMVHSTNILTFGLSMNDWKKDGFLRLIVFTIVKITSTNKEIPDSRICYFLAVVVRFLLFGGFANKRESCTYDSVYYLRREKTTKNTLNITFFWENVSVPLYGCMLSFVEIRQRKIFKTTKE